MVKKKVLELANKIGAGITAGLIKVKPTDPEYKILEPVVTDEMAEVALHLEIRKPKRLEEVVAKCKRPADEVEKILLQLAEDGVIKVEKEEGVDTYFLETLCSRCYGIYGCK